MAYTNPDAGSAQSGITYQLKLNKMVTKTKGANAYTATVSAPAISLSKLAQRMVDEGNAQSVRKVTETFDAIAETVAKYLNEGYAVNLGSLVRFRPSIKGTTASEDAVLTDAANPVVVTASAGTMIRDVAANATKIRITDASTAVAITGVRDNTTLLSTVITSQGSFIVQGTNLNWDTTAADEGFFVAVNGEETKAELLDGESATSVVLKNAATWTEEGVAITLTFRTRSVDGTLKQFAYDGTLTTALNA